MSRDTFDNHLDFDLNNLHTIYNDLLRWKDQGTDQELTLLTERIKQMTEFQVWGEQNNEAFFEFFCEKNVVDLLFKILQKTQSREIVNEIIQSLSMYLLNLKKPTNINYILSSNAINEFITHPFDFNDDEIVAYYISFLKGLSLRMEAIPLDLFYNQKYIDFPLLSYAVRFYNYPNSMVRAAVQNITLNILKLSNQKLDLYLTNFPFISYFVNLACYLKDLWIQIDEVLPDSHMKNNAKLHELLDAQYDILIYIDDIFRLGRDKISQILANALLSYAIIPAMIAPLTSSKKGIISLNLSQHLLHLIFSCLEYPPLLETVYIILFSSKLNDAVMNFAQQVPKDPNSFQKKWSFNNFWDQHEEIMIQQYINLLKKVDYVDPNLAKTNPFGNRAFSQSKTQEVPSLLSYLDVRKLFASDASDLQKLKPLLEEEYRTLTRSTGVVADSSNPELEKLAGEAPLDIMAKLKENFTEKGDPMEMGILKENPVRSIFLLFLMSKDDNMAALMCSILNSAVNTQNISNKVIWMCGMMCEMTYFKKPEQIQNDKGGPDVKHEIQSKSYTIKYLLDLLYRLLIVDPTFRLATMSLIVKLIMELSWTRDEKVCMSPENLKVFNQGYLNIIGKTMKLLQTNSMVDYYAEVYNTQWEVIYKKDLEEIPRKNLIYTLLPVVEENVPGVDLSMRLPVTEYEILQDVISMFFLFRKIRYALIRTTKYSREFVESNNTYIQNDNVSNTWQEGKFYELDQRKLLPCYIKTKGTKQFCYIAEDEENFILITPDYTRTKWANILHNVKLKYVEATIDRSDPRLLMVVMKTKDKMVNKLITFDDHTLCLAAKKMMQENGKFSKHHETTQVLKDVEKAKSDVFVA